MQRCAALVEAGSSASRVCVSLNSRVAFEGCAETTAATAITAAAMKVRLRADPTSAKLRIHLLEVAAIDEHLARLAARAR